ncbi:hypothetical protein QV06_00090 [Gallibacterium genomosp. 3]|uniref:Cytolethal distending toxin subunit A n=1 Tax=Gallibacterium genomosp. 3 TaxID=505345 RepID=A0A1A7PW65_9PAST|nr:hypothetical protein [Gallibacterium genomosp. 3]OBX05991.1 hypothetical protein QV06_00090 [Gallibacterium genomosp. 3]
MKKLLFSIIILSITACSNSNKLGNTPIPPKGDIGKIVGKLPASNAGVLSRTINEPKVGIMNYSSGLITIWAVSPNNWLWGYSPFDSKSFGNLRHWYILKNPNGSVSFRNAEIGTCIAAHGNGIVHIGCNPNNLDQQFDFLSLTNGAVAIKNAFNQLCLRTPIFRSTTYMPLTFANCVKVGQNTLDQQWFITPPIEDSFPILTKG